MRCLLLQVGFVNSVRFSSDGLQLVAAVGQEHRLGRWWRLKQARNSLAVVKLTRRDDDTKSSVVKRKQSLKASKISLNEDV